MPARTSGRLPRGTLNREVILDAALRTLARPGAPPVTMRSLADELGADPTAVYRHFRSKDELLGALADRLLEQLPEPSPSAAWRDQLRALGAGLHGLLRRSPGAVVLLAESPFTPASLRVLDATLAALLRAGLDPRLAAEASQAVVLYALGHAAATARDPAGFWSGMADAGLAADELPALQAAPQAWSAPPAEQFEAGLELLLDGVAARAGVRRRAS